MQEIKPSIKSAKLTEEAIKKIARKAGFDQVLNVLRQTEQEVNTATEWEQRLEQDEQKLGELLTRVDEAIKEEEQLGKAEIQELQQDITGDQKIFKEIKEFLEPMLRKEHEGEQDSTAKQIVSKINSIEGELNGIDNHLEKLLKVKKIEYQEEEQASEAVENIMTKINRSP